MCKIRKQIFKVYTTEYQQRLIQKGKVDIDDEKGAQISIVAKRIVTQGWSKIMILKFKQAAHYICFLFPSFYVYIMLLIWQGSTNSAHSDKHACNVHTEVFACTKLQARKSIKTSLSSTPILFKVVSYFCVWKELIFGMIRSDIHNFFQLRCCC